MGVAPCLAERWQIVGQALVQIEAGEPALWPASFEIREERAGITHAMED